MNCGSRTDLSEERKKRFGTIMQHDTMRNKERQGDREKKIEKKERKREKYTVHAASNVRGFARPSITIN